MHNREVSFSTLEQLKLRTISLSLNAAIFDWFCGYVVNFCCYCLPSGNYLSMTATKRASNFVSFQIVPVLLGLWFV